MFLSTFRFSLLKTFWFWLNYNLIYLNLPRKKIILQEYNISALKFWKYIVLYIQFGGQIIFSREELNYIFYFVISSFNQITSQLNYKCLWRSAPRIGPRWSIKLYNMLHRLFIGYAAKPIIGCQYQVIPEISLYQATIKPCPSQAFYNFRDNQATLKFSLQDAICKVYFHNNSSFQWCLTQESAYQTYLRNYKLRKTSKLSFFNSNHVN
jgi:hypothetical protein